MSQKSSFDPLTAVFVAVPAIALASVGGIGVVGGGIAFGLSSLELGAIGALGGYGARRALKKQTKRLATPAPSISVSSTEIDDLRSGRF